MATIEDFMKLDIRIGKVVEAEVFKAARKPAYKLLIDFGPLGVKKTSAQITELYNPEELVGKMVTAVVNFPPRQIGPLLSEVLVLGALTMEGVVLITPEDGPVKLGDKIA